jgi:hypothetical protein
MWTLNNEKLISLLTSYRIFISTSILIRSKIAVVSLIRQCPTWSTLKIVIWSWNCPPYWNVIKEVMHIKGYEIIMGTPNLTYNFDSWIGSELVSSNLKLWITKKCHFKFWNVKEGRIKILFLFKYSRRLSQLCLPVEPAMVSTFWMHSPVSCNMSIRWFLLKDKPSIFTTQPYIHIYIGFYFRRVAI